MSDSWNISTAAVQIKHFAQRQSEVVFFLFCFFGFYNIWKLRTKDFFFRSFPSFGTLVEWLTPFSLFVMCDYYQKYWTVSSFFLETTAKMLAWLSISWDRRKWPNRAESVLWKQNRTKSWVCTGGNTVWHEYLKLQRHTHIPGMVKLHCGCLAFSTYTNLTANRSNRFNRFKCTRQIAQQLCLDER